MADHGNPIAYMVLQEGTPVLAADGDQIGKVKRVLADDGADIFDGITIDAHGEERFVDASQVDALYERAVLLTLAAADAKNLPEHSPSPAVIDTAAQDLVEDTPSDQVKGVAKRAWNRISGNY